jgi:hypothetical protein
VVSTSAQVLDEATVGKKVSERTESVGNDVPSTRIDADDDAHDGIPFGKRRCLRPERRTDSALGHPGVERSMSP